MPEYRTPGVYVEEISRGDRPITAVGTRTAGFIGRAPLAAAQEGKALFITNWSQFRSQFFPELAGPPAPGQAAKAPLAWNHLAHAVYGFFLNGGSRCYVVNTAEFQAGLAELARIDEVAIVAAPGHTSPEAYQAILDHCERLRDRVGILDGPEEIGEAELRLLGGDETATGSRWTPPQKSGSGLITLYVPWLVVSDPTARLAENRTVTVPPSGHIAGIWARSDATRGVHKAPANEPVRGALDLVRRISHAEQQVLNDNGVNVIRFFPSEGILVWGARTWSPKGDSTWRYLNVRRLFNLIQESIREGTRWIVFEPNDRSLWQAIRRDVEAFLLSFWRDGALMGRTPQEAFFVKCDEETNPPESIAAGKVVIEVGLAPIRPAEFVIFRITQCEADSEGEVIGG